MKEKIQQILDKIRPGLGGTVVTFVEEKKGVVKVNIFVASCGPVVSEDLVVETLDDEFKKKLPGYKKVVVVK